MKRTAYRCLTLCAPLMAVACQPVDTAPYHPTVVTSRDQAAAILVSVNSVAPWDQVADSLAPNFSLANGDAAASQVAPITQRVQEQVLSAFGLNFGLGLAQVPAPGKTAPPSPTPPSNPALPSAPAPQLPTTSGVSGDIGIDPTLKYQAALALYQAVQLMNHEIQNAAVLTCSVPYVVQLKLAIVPYRHNLPYDLHARICFFTDPAPAAGVRAPVTPKGAGFTTTLSAQARLPGATTGSVCDNDAELPQIVPMLVTDDIERALKSRAVETATQIGLALSAAYAGVGANLSANSANQALSAVSGQDLNNRLTVTRQSDNTIYAKIGATSEATAQYALVGQTYDISLLLLVPRGYIDKWLTPPTSFPAIDVVTYTELRSVIDGSVLPERPTATLVNQADSAMADVLGPGYPTLYAQWTQLDATTREKIARCLASNITTSLLSDFEQNLDQLCGIAAGGFSLNQIKDPNGMRGPTGSEMSLWTRLSVLLADSAFKSAYFELLPREDVIVPDQTTLVLDDTKTNAQVILQNVTGAQSRTLTASLELAVPTAGGKQTYSLPAQSISFDAGNRLLTLTFPSLVKWNITGVDWASSHVQIKPQLCSTESVCPNFLLPKNPIPVSYAKAASTTSDTAAPSH